MAEQADGIVYDQLAEKLELLHKISINTKLQIQFIRQRKTKGLLRLLRERSQYLQEWYAFPKGIDSASSLADCDEKMKKVLLLIKAKQQEIIQEHYVAIDTAKAEQVDVMADLRRVGFQIKVQKSYDCQRMNIGSRLNLKG